MRAVKQKKTVIQIEKSSSESESAPGYSPASPDAQNNHRESEFLLPKLAEQYRSHRQRFSINSARRSIAHRPNQSPPVQLRDSNEAARTSIVSGKSRGIHLMRPPRLSQQNSEKYLSRNLLSPFSSSKMDNEPPRFPGTDKLNISSTNPSTTLNPQLRVPSPNQSKYRFGRSSRSRQNSLGGESGYSSQSCVSPATRLSHDLKVSVQRQTLENIQDKLQLSSTIGQFRQLEWSPSQAQAESPLLGSPDAEDWRFAALVQLSKGWAYFWERMDRFWLSSSFELGKLPSEKNQYNAMEASHLEHQLLRLGLAYAVKFTSFFLGSPEEPVSWKVHAFNLISVAFFLLYLALVLAKQLDSWLGMAIYSKEKDYSKLARSLDHIILPLFVTLLGSSSYSSTRASEMVASILLSVYATCCCQDSKKAAPALLGQVLLISKWTTLTIADTALMGIGLASVLSGVKLKRQSKSMVGSLISQIRSLQRDQEGIIQSFPKGVLIYRLEELTVFQRSFSFADRQAPPTATSYRDIQTNQKQVVNVNHINQELVSILNLMDMDQGIQMNRLEEPLFKQIKFKPDGASTSEQKLSLKEILMSQSTNQEILYFQVSKPASSEPSYARQTSYDRSSFSVNSVTRNVQILEMTIREVCFLGKPSFMVTVQDISSIIESQNSKMQQHYQEALMATMSHEQMNPLNSIINFNEYLLEWTNNVLRQVQQGVELRDDLSLTLDNVESIHSSADSEDIVPLHHQELQQQFKILTIMKSSARLMQLLNLGMLNLALMKQQKFTPAFETIKDPFALLKGFTALFRPHLKQKDLTFLMPEEIQGDLVATEQMNQRGILIDAQVYQQILYNVFTNACKFNNNKGKIKLTFSAFKSAEEDRLKITTVVEDTGEGIDRETKKNLFKVFEHIRKVRRPESELIDNENLLDKGNRSGCGLGLFLSLQLSQFFDGDIEIDSLKGKGTSVKISIMAEVSKPQTESVLTKVARHHSQEILLETEREASEANRRKNALNNIYKRYKESSIVIAPNLVRYDQVASAEGMAKFLMPPGEYGEQELSVPLRRSTMDAQIHTQGLHENFFISQKNSSKRGSIVVEGLCSHGAPGMMRKSRSYVLDEIEEGNLSVSESVSQTSRNLSPESSQVRVHLRSAQTAKFHQTVERHGSFQSDSPVVDELNLFDRMHRCSISSEGIDDHNLNEFMGRQILQEKVLELGKLKELGSSSLGREDTLTEGLIDNTQAALDFMENSSSSSGLSSDQQSSSSSISQSASAHAFQLARPIFEEEEKMREQDDGHLLALPQVASSSRLTQINEDDEEDKQSELPDGMPQSPDSFPDTISFQKQQSLPVLSTLPKSWSSKKKQRASSFRKTIFGSVMSSTGDLCNCKQSPILIIEDNKFNQEALKLMIKGMFKTTPAVKDDGLEGLNEFVENYEGESIPQCSSLSCDSRSYKLIFMDLNMPKMDGFESAEKILAHQRAKPRPGKCVIVALTAFVDPANVSRCHQIGMTKVINKPAQKQEIFELIKEHCPNLSEV